LSGFFEIALGWNNLQMSFHCKSELFAGNDSRGGIVSVERMSGIVGVELFASDLVFDRLETLLLDEEEEAAIRFGLSVEATIRVTIGCSRGRLNKVPQPFFVRATDEKAGAKGSFIPSALGFDMVLRAFMPLNLLLFDSDWGGFETAIFSSESRVIFLEGRGDDGSSMPFLLFDTVGGKNVS
jgi:hypothetical protein